MFADDFVWVSESGEQLQRVIDVLKVDTEG